MPAPSGRLWPKLFLLGNPKSGSTFLFSCLRSGPFDPNLLYGTRSSEWGKGAYLLTTLGTKKEFNFFGGPGYSWGWEWYMGVDAPLSAWEWTDEHTTVGGSPRRRRGENGNGEPSAFVDGLCRMANSSLVEAPRRRRAKTSLACRRFPLECIEGTPFVRPGCGLVRPLPSRRHCGRAHQPTCKQPKVRLSHGWPPTEGISARAWTLDPSINTFMSAPAASEHLRDAAPGALSRMRFIILLREPIMRAQSSARMMREWKWDRAANLSDSMHSDLDRLRRCCEVIAPASRAYAALDGTSGMEASSSPFQRAASELPRLSDRSLRRFRDCLAQGHPLNHVRGSVYAAAVLGWLSAGFGSSQFLWLETDAMRMMPALTLLRKIAVFSGLPSEHLSNLPIDIRRACEARSWGGRVAASENAGRRGADVDGRMQVHAHRALATTLATVLQDAYRPFNALLRTLLADVADPSVLKASWMQ